VLTGRRENERRNWALEREVVEGYATVEVGENGLSVFVDGEEQVAFGVQGETGDVATMGEREGMRLVVD
jgi:hypothetical protein